MKILQVIDQLDAGGAERVMVDCCNLLQKQGHEVTVVNILEEGVLCGQLNKAVRMTTLHRKARLSIKALLALGRYAKKADIVHVHMRHNLKYVALCQLVTGFKAPVILHDHFGEIHRDQAVDPMLKRAMKKKFYIGVSRQLRDWAREKLEWPESRTFLLSNMIVRREVEAVARVGDPKVFKMLVVSNYRPQKNIEFAIDILNGVIKAGVKAELDLVGQPVDAEYQATLKAKVNALGLESKVRWITNCADIQPLLKGYDIALHTAFSETGPLVLMEYLSQNLRFLSYNTGEVVRQLAHEVPAFVINKFEVEDWVSRVLSIRESAPDHRLEELYHRYYSPDRYYEQCLTIYKQCLNS